MGVCISKQINDEMSNKEDSVVDKELPEHIVTHIEPLCILERATDHFIQILTKIVNRINNRELTVSHFKRFHSMYRDSVIDRMYECSEDTDAITIKALSILSQQLSPCSTRKTLELHMETAKTLLVAMCLPWEFAKGVVQEQCKRKLTTCVIRFCIQICQDAPRRGGYFMVKMAIEAARRNKGHLFHKFTSHHVAFCCGTIATFCRIKDEYQFQYNWT